MKKVKGCSYCGQINHFRYQCYKLNKLKPKKEIKRTFIKPKVDVKWIQTKREWYRANPPDHSGYYYCHYCNTPLTAPSVTLDHMHPKGNFIGRAKKYVLSNLVPACWPCNSRKGSMAYIPYCRKYAPHLIPATRQE